MQPDAFKIEDINTLHQLFRAYRPHDGAGWFFRGQADLRWPLIPKAGRHDYALTDLIRETKTTRFRDLARFNHWTKQVFQFAPELPTHGYEALAFAQHHGLATRLLDWSLNPLVATYFSVREYPDVDGAIYCYSPHLYVDVQQATLPTPGSESAAHWNQVLDEGGEDGSDLEAEIARWHGAAVITRAFDMRMLNQRGVFTVHWPPESPLAVAETSFLPGTKNVSVLIIPAALKRELREHLDDYGVNDAFIYPDVDGVASHVNWQTQNLIRRARSRG